MLLLLNLLIFIKMYQHYSLHTDLMQQYTDDSWYNYRQGTVTDNCSETCNKNTSDYMYELYLWHDASSNAIQWREGFIVANHRHLERLFKT